MIAASVLHFVEPMNETSTLSKGIIVKKTLSLLAASVVAMSAGAQTFSPTLGQGATLDQQVIGDTVATADRTQSTSIQQGNSANQFGNDLGNNVDTRDQNTNNVQGGSATGGAAIGNQSDNKSSVGNTSASNGPQTMGQANTGNSTVGNTSSNSGGNNLATGPSTATTGASTSTAQGGTGHGGQGGQGGTGGTATSSGTNLGINGQQQGIDRSGNSTNANTAGGNTGGNSANRNSMTGGAQNSAQATNAGNGAGAGAGSNNRTAMTVDASDRSSTSYVAKSIALPPILHGNAAPPLASASMTVIPGICGPRHYTETVPVKGTHHGILWDSKVEQGNDYTAVPATTPFIEKDGYLIGHVLNEFVAVVGTSSSKSISGWGVGSSQAGGGAGAANSGSHQQLVVRITIKDCLMPVKAPAAVIPPMVVVPQNPAVLTPKADRN